jgi:hypothetical protein
MCCLFYGRKHFISILERELIDHVDDEKAGLGWIRFHGWIKRPDL